MTIQIYRNNAPLLTLPIDERVVFTHSVMGEHKVAFERLEMPYVIDVQLGDTLEYKGKNYTINTVPEYGKINNFKHVYSINFESDIYKMYDKKFMHLGDMEFQYFGKATDFIMLVVENMNEIDSDWLRGIVEDTTEKHIDFNGESCRTALTRIAEEFKLEYEVNGKTIDLMKQIGSETSLTFEYGRGKGLYSLERQYVQDKNVITRAYGVGGTRNLPKGHKGRRLMFDEKYLESNIDLYGIKEGEYRNEEIYPKRVGTITSVEDLNLEALVFRVTDSSLDFNVSNCFIDGIEPKLGFQTGELTGYEFVIQSYDHASRTFVLQVDKSATDYVLPNSVFKASVGDFYSLFDIDLPNQYYVAAKDELKANTQEFLHENHFPRVVYGLNVNLIDMRDKGYWINPGDRVTIKDEKLKLDERIRVTSISYPICYPDAPLTNETYFNAEVASFVPYLIQERIIKDTKDNQKEIVVIDRRNAERARRNAYNLRQLRDVIFDADDYFDNTNIRPNSIETLHLSVGAKSQNFGLNGVEINANTGGNPNHLTISSGALIHYEVEIDGLGYVWQMANASFPSLDSNKYYYVAARCSRTSLVGEWVMSETPIKTEEQPGVWYFNLGVLYAVKDGYRSFDFTNGMTYIVGDRITTGRIQSLDGLNYYDLTQGKFNLGDEVSGIDWDVTNPGVLTIRGAVASSTVVVGSGGFVSAGLSGESENGDQSVRFWAGADLLNNLNAPFRVLNDGSVIATKGRIGFLNVTANALTLGENQDSSDSWTAGMNVVSFYSNYFLYRMNGAIRGQIRELAYNLYSNVGGSFATEAARITNTIDNDEGIGLERNIGLSIDVANSRENIALNVMRGDVRFSNGRVYVDGQPTIDAEPQIQWGTQNGEWFKLKIVNGQIVGITYN